MVDCFSSEGSLCGIVRVVAVGVLVYRSLRMARCRNENAQESGRWQAVFYKPWCGGDCARDTETLKGGRFLWVSSQFEVVFVSLNELVKGKSWVFKRLPPGCARA